MFKESIININEREYKIVVNYQVSASGMEIRYIGYVDVRNIADDYCIYHANLTVRDYEELKDKTDEEIEELAMNEAKELIGEPIKNEISKFVELYEDAKSKGRY